MKKKIATIILTFIILFCFGIIKAKAQGVITEIKTSGGEPVLENYEITVPLGDTERLDMWLSGFIRIYATVDGQQKTLYVDWDYTELTGGINQAGSYSCSANIIANGYTFGAGVSDKISVKINVEDMTPDIKTIVSFEDMRYRYAYPIEKGAEWQEFWNTNFHPERWESAWICYTDNGETEYGDIVWENPDADTSKEGVITVKGHMALPENTKLADGVTLPEIETFVSVQEEPTLNCWSMDNSVIYIPWIMEENANITYYISKDGGEWQDGSEIMDNNSFSLCIWHTFLNVESEYKVKAAYNGKETNIFYFRWTGAVSDWGSIEGDRDGGDTEGTPPVDTIQPAPDVDEEITLPSDDTPTQPEDNDGTQPDQDNSGDNTGGIGDIVSPVPDYEGITPPSDTTPGNNSSANQNGNITEFDEMNYSATSDTSAQNQTDGFALMPYTNAMASTDTFMEEVTEYYSLLSGARVLLMKNSDGVRFSKQGITVTLSDTAINAMRLKNDSRFYIEIKMTEKGFFLKVTIDDIPVYSLPDTVVQIPLEQGQATAALYDEQGNTIQMTGYHNGVASFALQNSGEYRLSTQPVSVSVANKNVSSGNKTNNSGYWLLLLVPIIAVALLFVRRWRP